MMKFDSFHDLLCIANRPSDQGSQYRSFIEDIFCGGMPTWLTCDRGLHLVCVCAYAMYILFMYICSYRYVYIHTIIIWYPSKHLCLCLFDILHLDSQSLVVLWCQCNVPGRIPFGSSPQVPSLCYSQGHTGLTQLTLDTPRFSHHLDDIKKVKP